MAAILFLIVVVILLTVKVPIAFAMAGPAMVYFVVADGVTINIAFQRLAAALNSFPLLAVPLFILIGYIANGSGIAKRLVDFATLIAGRVRGRLAYANVSTSVVFSWMSGTSLADAAALGAILVPSMRDQGYKESFSVGLTAASSIIGPVMPPSIAAIIYGVTAEVSIGGLFLAGVIPAFLMAAMLGTQALVSVRSGRAFAERASSAGSMGTYSSRDSTMSGASARPEVDVSEAGQSSSLTIIWRAAPALLTPIIVIGGILGGVFTPTEAAAVASAYLVLLTIVYRSLSLRSLLNTFVDAARTTAQIGLIVGSGALFAFIIAREGLTGSVVLWIDDRVSSPLVFLIGLNIFLLGLGTVLDTVSSLIVTVPVALPAAVAVGVDPLHLGIVMVLNLGIGSITPPIGFILYVLSGVTGLSVGIVVKGVLPFLVTLLCALALVTWLPFLSLWLPGAGGL